MHPMLNIAVRAARTAGNLIARNIGQSQNFEVAEKNKDDLVTDIDKECEKTITQIILKSYRDHCVIGEEAGAQGNPDSEYKWIISKKQPPYIFEKKSLRVFSNSSLVVLFKI